MTGPSSPRLRVDLRQVQPDGSLLMCGTHLRVRLAVLNPGQVLVTAQGEVSDAQDVSAEAAMLAELEAELERAGTLMLFADLRMSQRMPAASRERLAQWGRRHQARLLTSHMLVRSKLLEMALSIITMIVGGSLFRIHTDAQAFLQLVQKVAPELSELPRVPT